MRYKRLGTSGLRVSVIGVGCMSFGDKHAGTRHSAWTLDEGEAEVIVKTALDAGVNFFDTANVYSKGTSEEITGRLLGKLASRDDIVLATKVFQPMRDGPTAGGLSRKEILHEIDESLRRLGTDYVDLYQIHRWDDETPIEETMEALHDVVRAGKARYIGASSMHAWQFAKAQHAADLGGWTRFVSMQNHYNLLHRLEELEMIPQCLDQGVGVIPYSPLARGKLTRDWDETTPRSDADESSITRYREDEGRSTVELVAEIAASHKVPRAQVALAWLLAQPAVTAPIVGSTKSRHLEDAIAAVDITLSESELARLGAGSPPPYRGFNTGAEVLRNRRS
jgi:1-deoxyxylulose-5-phosphate synthase